jgi:hypothetical protein
VIGGSALSVVDVAGEISITIANKLLIPCTMLVIAPVVQSYYNVPEQMFYSCLVLHRRRLHEPTDEAHGEHDVWPCMHEVAQASDDTTIERDVNGRIRALLAQL